MQESEDQLLSNSEKKEETIYLLSLLDKFVKVELIKSISFNGFVHSIDPVTKTMILSVPHKGTFQTTLIPGHAILNISETTTSSNINPPPHKESPTVNKEEILIRKNKLVAWFKKNLLPVEEKGENLVVGSVNVLPPYSPVDIYAENPVVILQIRNMIEKMPHDFEF